MALSLRAGHVVGKFTDFTEEKAITMFLILPLDLALLAC
jgi:hypothetical protein